MNILYFLQQFPKVSETFILNEISELENRGHNVAVFALGNPDEEILHEEFEDLEAEIYYPEYPSYSDLDQLLWTKLAKPSFLKTLKLNKGLKNRLTQAYMTREIVRFAKNLHFEPEIIQTHFSNKSKLPAYSASKILNIPFTIEVHAYDIFSKDKKEFSQKFLKKPDKIITVSEYNKNYLQTEFDIKKPIDVVPVSIDTEKFKPQGLEEQNKIVSVARLVEKKGFKYGIKAFAQIANKYPDLEYNIIGKGDKKKELEKLVEEEGLEDRVNLLGHVTDERLKREIEESKAFLLPCVIAENGDRDAMPMVVKESMSLETPCVSTTVSALPEIIEDAKDGYLVEPKNADELAEKISELLDSEHKRSKFGENARKKVISQYDISSNAAKIESIFEKVK